MKTAEEFLASNNGFDDNDMVLLAKSLKTENRMDISDISRTMIEFAQMHVKAALKTASEKATAGDNDMYFSSQIDQESILNSYPVSNIK